MPEKSELTINEKLGLGLFVLICFCALAIGGYRWAMALTRPFGRTGTGDFQSVTDKQAAEIQRLKETDTDHDGLSDYDEIYIFHTSAFNPDSDSDGIPDGEEVRRGTDPNCPEGKTCRAVAPAVNGTANAAPTPPDISQKQLDLLTTVMGVFGDLSQLTPEAVKQRVQGMSSAELRGFLLKLEIPQAALDKSDDATLKQMLIETITEMINEGNQNSPSAAGAAAGTDNP